MLLPSALSCDQILAQPKPTRPSRPKLPSFERYDGQQRASSPMVGLIASCRALHTMLGERFSSPSPTIEQTLRAQPMSSPFGEPSPPPVVPIPARGHNKRRRNEFEDDISPIGSSRSSSPRNPYSTPKRRRIIPLELPPGLQASDFEALAQSTKTSEPRNGFLTPTVEMPECSKMPAIEAQSSTPSWTDVDDKLLVETVLNKLNLSVCDWNDCAQQLGKDKDSIGRRWKMLLGEGNIGLRRGTRRMDRVDLDIKSW